MKKVKWLSGLVALLMVFSSFSLSAAAPNSEIRQEKFEPTDKMRFAAEMGENAGVEVNVSDTTISFTAYSRDTPLRAYGLQLIK